MDKEVLVQYSEIMVEVKDIRKRIQKLQSEIEHMEIVSDSVKGTRPDGTYGSIKITGYPTTARCRKEAALRKYRSILELREAEMLELMTEAEEYIESIPKSELRIMFRLYYLDGLTWVQVAHRMNAMFPRRRVKYTEDALRMRNNRFFES